MSSERTEASRDAIHATDGYKTQITALDRVSRLLIEHQMQKDEGLIRSRLIELGWTPPWEPIETAPRDGSPFIGWVSAVRMALGEDDDYREYDASEADFCRWIAYPDDPDGDHFENDSGQIGDQQRITHWLNVKPPRSMK